MICKSHEFILYSKLNMKKIDVENQTFYHSIGKYYLILTLLGASQGQQKAGKVTGANQKQIEEHLTTNQVNQQQVSNMTEYERSISERQSLSANYYYCNKLHPKIVEQFQKNVPQSKSAKPLKIPPSAVHHQKIQRIRRSVCVEGTRLKIKTGYVWSSGPQAALQ